MYIKKRETFRSGHDEGSVLCSDCAQSRNPVIGNRELAKSMENKVHLEEKSGMETPGRRLAGVNSALWK
jgi:hypothetical protein